MGAFDLIQGCIDRISSPFQKAIRTFLDLDQLYRQDVELHIRCDSSGRTILAFVDRAAIFVRETNKGLSIGGWLRVSPEQAKKSCMGEKKLHAVNGMAVHM